MIGIRKFTALSRVGAEMYIRAVDLLPIEE